MRLLYASERPPFPFFMGGAARSAHHLLSILTKDFSVECSAVGSKDFVRTPWSCPCPEEHDALGITEVSFDNNQISIRCGYPVRVIRDFATSLTRMINDFAPDVLWTQLDGAESIAHTARRKGLRTLVYLRDAEDAPAMLKSLVTAGVSIVCNSGFMAERVRRITGAQAHVIYPSLDIAFGVNGDPSGYITMINPHRVKGIDTFFEIARCLSNERFLLVESWTLSDAQLGALKEKLASLPNVRFLRRVPDAQEIYRQTKLLLVPSIWEEAFGRVVIEAQSCHIPVIASARGGLPESVGDGGMLIQDYRNPRAWVEAIGGVLSGPVTYRDYADRAYRHSSSENFSPAEGARRFMSVCTSEVQQPTVLRRSMQAAGDRIARFPVLGGLFRRGDR